MHRHKFLAMLDSYMESFGSIVYQGKVPREDEVSYITVRQFTGERPDCFERSCVPGHITGSALVVTEDLEQVLLTHHAKLDKWLQLGGHADGDPEIPRVALKEAEEESGLQDLQFFPFEELFNEARHPLPFDLDSHLIPARGKEPEHVHHDTRFLLTTASPETIAVSHESHDLRWFTWEQARRVTKERSMIRQFEKIAWLRTQLGG